MFTALVVMGLSAPLMAQQTQATDVAQATGGTATTAQSGATGEQLQEVTVTAERVVASEQRTPIAITEISQQALTQQNVVSSDQLKGLVPSLNIVTQGGGGPSGNFGQNEMAIYVRGVGTASRFFNNDTGVGVYLDDVYLADTQNLNLSFFDLQNIQVLEGPQGTLFGRNSFGGAVLLTTAPPAPEFGGYAMVRVGSYNRVDTQGAVNMPFTDVLTSRFAFYTSNVDGYITHLLDSGTNDDIHEKTARYELHFQPSSAFTADLMAEYGASDDDGNEGISVGCNPNAHYTKDYAQAHPNSPGYCAQYSPLGQRYEVYGNTVSNFPEPPLAYVGNYSTTGGSALSNITGIAGPSGLTSSPGGRLPFDTGVMSTLSLRMQWVLNDALSLKSITGLRRSDLDSYRDDGTPVGLYTELDDFWDENYSEELQALAKLWGGRLNLVFGVFYYLDSADSIQDTGPDYDDPVGYYYGNILSEHSWAAYGQGTLNITDKLSIIGGVRDTHDIKTSSSEVWEGCYGSYIQELTGLESGGVTGGCWIPGPLMGDYATATHSWSHIDPRLQLQYQLTPDIMGYASADSGYEAGGFNAQLPFLPPPGVPTTSYYNLPFQQETLWNYEAGIKTEWFNHRVRLNADGFDEIFDNLQTSLITFYNGIDVSTTSSGADAHERGVEAQLDVIPVDNLTLSANFSDLAQGYDAIFPAAIAAGVTKAAHISAAPNKQGSIIGTYTFHLGNGATIVPNVNWRFVGNQWSGTYPLQYLAPSYALFGTNVAYNAPGNKWSISYWCTNCTNKYYYASYASPQVLNTNMGVQGVVPGRPREMGLLFTTTF